MNVKKLNEYKRKSNLTNVKIADITGITLSNIDKIMAGSNTNPKLDTISAICKAVGCTLDNIDDGFDRQHGGEDFCLSSHEKLVISEYRKSKDIQMAVDRFLGIDPLGEYIGTVEDGLKELFPSWENVGGSVNTKAK